MSAVPPSSGKRFAREVTTGPLERVVFTSYYTPEYAGEVGRLLASFRRFEVSYDVRERASQNSWNANTRAKLHHLAEVFREYPEHAVVWLDADAELVGYPMLFGSLYQRRINMAAHVLTHRPTRKGGTPRREFLGGTMYFGPNPWGENGSGREDFAVDVSRTIGLYSSRYRGEQGYISETMVLWAARQWLRFEELPESYTAIFDRKVSNPVIVHHQASRRLQRVVDRRS